MNDFEKISNGICPRCGSIMEPTSKDSDWICKICKKCYHYVDLDSGFYEVISVVVNDDDLII